MTWLKENWFKISIIVILVVVAVYYFVTSSHRQELSKNLDNDIAMQTKCADRAALFYKQGDYEDNPQGFSNSYINHWNKKLGKCFVQINSSSIKDDSVSIDVFDAFEGKHYAMYMGHNFCDSASLVVLNDPKRCQLDSGSIWFDGNDTRNPADYHVGFEGIANGHGVGDANTQKQFLEHIESLMND
jgi:hypothetical protein